MNVESYGPYAPGQHWVFSVPPGWILSGTIARIFVEENAGRPLAWVEWKDPVYLESCNQGYHTYGIAELKPQQMKEAIARSNRLVDGFITMVEAITHAAPSQHGFRILSRAPEAEAVKGR